MQVESDLVRESKRRSDLISSRLKELLERLKSKSKGADHAELAELSRALFGRAPIEFLERSPANDLARVTSSISSCVAEYVKGKDAVTVLSDPSLAGLCITLSDRPFIVNTIMECCREKELRVLTLLHPIISKSGKALSVNYLEVDSQDKGELDKLTDIIKSALTALRPVTDDFSSMLKAADKLATNFHKSKIDSEDTREAAQFIHWLTEGAFNFLGYCEFEFEKNKEPSIISGTQLGLCAGDSIFSNTLKMEITSDCRIARTHKRLVTVTGLLSTSPVHRRTRMTHALIAACNEKGEIRTLHSFVGLFTSRALAQECSTIPLIRRKFQEVVKSEGFIENTHDYKSVANIIDSLPKDEALALDSHSLRSIVTSVLDVGTSSETVVSMWADPQSRGFSIMLVMLRERFEPAMKIAIGEYIENIFHNRPSSSEHHLDITNRPVVRLYYHVGCSPETLQNMDMKGFRAEIAARACSWQEMLERGLARQNFNGSARNLSSKYGEAFPHDYRALQNIDDCLQDIANIEQLASDSPLRVALANFEPAHSNKGTVVVYSLTDDFTISRVLPALENAGFVVINERAWRIHPSSGQNVFSSRFRVHTKTGSSIDPRGFTERVAPALEKALVTGRDNDPLNALALEVHLDLRAILVLRTYCRFLWQINKFASRFSIIKTVSTYPKLAQRLWGMFELKFDPESKRDTDDRMQLFHVESAAFLQELRSVTDITADRIFRSLRTLLEHTVRTNYYTNKPYLALKFRSESIDIMPQPRPKFEIFVNAPQVEGVHLRSGAVARGGIRWSDRPDDYRSEVLGLMKTQRIKNALIVPTGAKGGFVVKQPPTDPKAIPQAVRESYSEYVRALLSVTDNRTATKVVHPESVICFDGEDPYFVVAADKGTASFSDTANALAVDEYNFWLGDAFASGGSNGYDHKLYAITAKGAWECVKRHFRDADVSFDAQPFTAIGIGDMAGDVFGNGLILSENYKLIAAFNHKHIFIDPSPDPKISFAERKRLFELKGSQWSDYNPKLISKGGKIFDRFDKEFDYRKMPAPPWGIPQTAPEVMNGDEVVHSILQAPVDLLWNGGIGTYVKSNSQSNADVGDSANDAVRINAEELKAKIVGEGGNLGFTQQGRIDFARLGGRINTDAIDNSGGVDLSDHEVNLKILFADLLRSKKITLPERNKLLKEMAQEVCESVLEHNRGQALILSLATTRSVKRLHYFQVLLRELVRLGYVNRALDALPDDDEMSIREKEGSGLTRPELAVCIATVKMWVKDAMLSTDLTANPVLDPLLLDYFPTAIQKRFGKEALKHPLRPNILATQATNLLIDCMGITAFNRLSTRHGVSVAHAAECALAAELMLGTRSIRRELMAADPHLGSKTYLALSQTLGNGLFDVTNWLLSRHAHDTKLDEIYSTYDKAWSEFGAKPDALLPAAAAARYRDRLKSYGDLGLSKNGSHVLALAPDIMLVFEILRTARESKHSISSIAPLYAEVVAAFAADTLAHLGGTMEVRSKWDLELLSAALEDIRRGVSLIVARLLAKKVSSDAVTQELSKVVALDKWRANVEELRARSAEVASLAVLSRQLQSYAQMIG